MSQPVQRKLHRIFILKYTSLLLFCALVLFPLLLLLFTSFKTDAEYVKTSSFSLPESFLYLENYKNAIINGDILTAFSNSGVLVLFGSLGSVLFGAMTAYCFCRFQFFGCLSL